MDSRDDAENDLMICETAPFTGTDLSDNPNVTRMDFRMSIRLFLLLPCLLVAGFGMPRTCVSREENGRDEWTVVAELSERRLSKEPENEKAWADLVQARLDGNDLKRAEKALNDWRTKVPNPVPKIEQLQGELAFDFKTGQINGAFSFRDCGSTLKPFLYAAGIDRRYASSGYSR
jgi:hypothetical protein